MTRRGRRPLHGQQHGVRNPGGPASGLAKDRQVRPVRLEGHDRGARVQGVGPLQGPQEAFEHRSPQGTGGAGGGKGTGQGEHGGGKQEPDTAPGSPVTGTQPRTVGPCGCLPVNPGREPGAVVLHAGICAGGKRVTGIPTATIRLR